MNHTGTWLIRKVEQGNIITELEILNKERETCGCGRCLCGSYNEQLMKFYS